MSTLVGDLVVPNDRVTFEDNVQLSSYPVDSHDPPLCCGYMFTGKAIQGYHSSVDLLTRIYHAFLHDGQPNRYVFLATYGHGKSHYALTMANFFGKDLDSPEVKSILDNIRHADPNSPTAQNFADFKAHRKPYLVVRLRGDMEEGLQQQLLQEVEIALHEHAVTREVVLPFWHRDALAFLAGLTADKLSCASDVLSKRQLDVPSLQRRIEEKDPSAFPICVDLHRELMDYPANFGGEVSLRQVVEWLALEYCGDGKPFPGMLILFDEFSQFVRDYAKGRGGIKGAPLQDLLNGVSNCKSKVVFVALSQHDPDTAADNAYAQMGHDSGRDDLRKELTRLPKEQRLSLYSELEVVIDSYLKQDDQLWGKLLQDNQVMAAVEDATNRTMALFADRYDSRLGWSTERFDDTITKGSFPLHPLTTALLCSVRFREVTSPRSVLGFVREQRKLKAEEAVVVDGRPNWVYPIALVDWFSDMLAEAEYEQYREAAASVGADITPAEIDVLKALLLQAVGHLRTRAIGFTRVISMLSGRSEEECVAALQALADGMYVRYDEAQHTYGFYALHKSVYQIDKWLREATTGKILDSSGLQEYQSKCSPQVLKPMPVSCDYGHSEDWAAAQFLMNRNGFSAQNIEHIVRKIESDKDFNSISRGYLIWLVADSDDDVEFFKAQAAATLDTALGNDSAPAVMVLPGEAQPALSKQILRRLALEGSEALARDEFGPDIYAEALKKTDQAIDKELRTLMEGSQFVVHQQYRVLVQLLTRSSCRPEHALKKIYEKAYRVPEFHTHLRGSSRNLQSAVGLVSQLLASQRASSGNLAQNGAAKTLVEKYLLRGNPRSWGILDLQGRMFEPENATVLDAWRLLEQEFAPERGEVRLRETLFALLNPPFGYDFNQLLILFCAWYGYNRQDLQISQSGRICTFEEAAGDFTKPRDAIFRLCYQGVRISRRDPSKEANEARQLIARVKSERFAANEAVEIRDSLAAFSKDDRNEAGLREDAERAAGIVADAISKAEQYDEAASKIKLAIERSRHVREVSEAIEKIKGLPQLGRVEAQEPDEAKLRTQALGRMQILLEDQCRGLSELGSLEDYGLKRSELTSLKAQVSDYDDDMTTSIDQALSRLDERKQELSAARDDAPIAAVLSAMSSTASLAELRSGLQNLRSLKPKAEDTKRRVAEKLGEMGKSIDDAVAFAQGLRGRVDLVTTVMEARQLRDAVQLQRNHYSDTPEAELLEDALARCDKLEGILSSLDEMETRPVSSPADADSLCAEIDKLARDHALVMSEAQLKQVSAARSRLSSKVEVERRNAGKWFQERETLASKPGDLERLVRELENPPPFLPDEQRGKLVTLLADVRQRWDEDTVGHVVAAFRKITDRQKQLECLEQLKKLIAE